MTKLAIIYFVFFLINTTTLLIAEPKNDRTAFLEDISGIKTECVGLKFVSDDIRKFNIRYFHSSRDLIGIKTQKYEIAIPVKSLISIERKSPSAVSVHYLWRNQTKVISGELLDGHFDFEGDFGNTELQSNKLKKLRFGTSPVSTSEIEHIELDVMITLRNDSKIAAGRVWRVGSERNVVVFGFGRTYDHFPNIVFKPSEASVTVNLDKIKKVEIQPENNIRITLKNGKKASGKISGNTGEETDGISGVSEKGYFFLKRALIKSIDYAE